MIVKDLPLTSGLLKEEGHCPRPLYLLAVTGSYGQVEFRYCQGIGGAEEGDVQGTQADAELSGKVEVLVDVLPHVVPPARDLPIPHRGCARLPAVHIGKGGEISFI